MTVFQGEQGKRETDAQIAMSSLQDELRLTQQAFHAKQNQLEGIFRSGSVPAFLQIWLQGCRVVPLLLWGQYLYNAYAVHSVVCMQSPVASLGTS